MTWDIVGNPLDPNRLVTLIENPFLVPMPFHHRRSQSDLSPYIWNDDISSGQSAHELLMVWLAVTISEDMMLNIVYKLIWDASQHSKAFASENVFYSRMNP